MITGVQDFYYSVTDVPRAKRFYLEGLGLKLNFEHEHWVSLSCGGVGIGLHPVDHKIAEVARDSHGARGGGTATFKSDNIAEDKERLIKYGAKILGEADQPWGHMLVLEDPDGNVLKLMNPKY